MLLIRRTGCLLYLGIFNLAKEIIYIVVRLGGGFFFRIGKTQPFS
ncbi:hypothetical protein THIOKS12580018 [Thiocapsa sp. KS1]|nr:hypothetical protein THIOKS12580018 [Thiocapsa sp. KS1]